MDTYFPGFMALFWPQLHALIDWRYKPVFLDKELQRLAASAKHGRLHVDKLVRVRLLSGQNLLALIHTEVQGQGGVDLPTRMATLARQHKPTPTSTGAVHLCLPSRSLTWKAGDPVAPSCWS